MLKFTFLFIEPVFLFIKKIPNKGIYKIIDYKKQNRKTVQLTIHRDLNLITEFENIHHCLVHLGILIIGN